MDRWKVVKFFHLDHPRVFVCLLLEYEMKPLE